MADQTYLSQFIVEAHPGNDVLTHLSYSVDSNLTGGIVNGGQVNLTCPPRIGPVIVLD